MQLARAVITSCGAQNGRALTAATLIGFLPLGVPSAAIGLILLPVFAGSALLLVARAEARGGGQ